MKKSQNFLSSQNTLRLFAIQQPGGRFSKLYFIPLPSTQVEIHISVLIDRIPL